MELLFLILKIVWIVLLAVVGLVLFLLCMILFVPIHYEISGSVTESKELSLKGKITYCLSIVKLIFSYQNGQTDMQISFFGFRKKRKEESVTEEDVTIEKEENAADIEENAAEIENTVTEESLEAPEVQEETLGETDKHGETPKAVSEYQKQEETEIVEDSEKTTEEVTRTDEEALNEFQDKKEINSIEEEQTAEKSVQENLFEEDIAEKLEASKQAEKNFKKKPKKKRGRKLKSKKREKIQKEKGKKEKTENKFNFAFIKQQLTDENNHYVVKKTLSEIKYLLKHFGLRKIKTDLVFSAGDPALTGQVLGGLCVMTVLYRYEFGLVPDFESEELYIKGTFLATGRIRLIHVFITAFRLILDKKVRMVTKNVITLLRSE